MITESQIKSALKRIPTSGMRSIELVDDGERGAGRLVLSIRLLASENVSAEWYAKFYTGGKRQMRKIAAYPAMGLSDARRLFRDQYAPAISSGAKVPDGVKERREKARSAPTFGSMIEGFIASVEARDGERRPALRNTLCHAVDFIGKDTPASEVTTDDLTPLLTKIYKRRAGVMADTTRTYLHAAFAWALRAQNNYKDPSAVVNWGLTGNPVSSIPPDYDCRKVGTRVLTPDEFRDFWSWLEGEDDSSVLAAGLRLVMATGQRPGEIIMLGTAESTYRIKFGTFDPTEYMLDWSTTKNKMPHCIPLPRTAAQIIDALIPNRNGLFFPKRGEPKLHASEKAFISMVYRYLKDHPGVEHFTPRDLRRTWKTLAGRAGLSKEIRDRLQNHAKSDVSSKHYDRYDYLPERRAAMERWNGFLTALLAGENALADFEGRKLAA